MLRLVVTGSLRWGRVVASVQHQRVRAAGGERSEDEVALLAAELELEEREAVGCARGDARVVMQKRGRARAGIPDQRTVAGRVRPFKPDD